MYIYVCIYSLVDYNDAKKLNKSGNGINLNVGRENSEQITI